MDNIDAIMLGWLAREARFHIYVYFAPDTPIGYQVNRGVTITRRNEPLFMQWMESRHDISTRRIQNNDGIQQIIDLLWPMRELVYDRDGMERMQHLLKSYPRRWKHGDVLRLVTAIDDGSFISFSNTTIVDDDSMERAV